IDRTETLEDVVRTELFTHHETILFMRAARFLWTVRCHLHFLTGRPEERLSFDLQPELANRMGYFDRAGQLGVERFMKRYFIAAKDVGGLTRILAAKLESQEKAKPRGLRRLLGADGKQALPGGDFSVIGGRVCINEDEPFLARPANLMRLFKTADETGMDIHPDAMSLVARNVRRITPQARRDPDTVTAFLDILLDGKSPGTALTRMNETGVLGRFIPEFGGIVAQTQFNMYHHYTVDEHTLRAVSHIADMESGEPGFELAQRLIGLVKNRRALYLAMLLHDTGKGKGDQQIEGMVTARAACQRFGLSDTETDLVAWLVGNHLEMSESAQKRDISDPRTIGKFADLVGNLERMRLLYILTVADIRAVGPNVWNAWKGQLLADLYFATEAVLRGGRTDEKTVLNEIQRRASSHRAEVAEAIDVIPPVLAEMEDPYWTGFDSETIILHANLLASDGSPTVNVRVRADAGGTEVFVSAADRDGLFARLVSAIDAQEANIISAQVFTGKSGSIVDVFVLQNDDGEPFALDDPYRLERLEKA
ncbi:MAG: [protein-PII] uridylyltransferase, partial [Henriciella sp.]